jgi:hypothetical protein
MLGTFIWMSYDEAYFNYCIDIDTIIMFSFSPIVNTLSSILTVCALIFFILMSPGFIVIFIKDKIKGA